MIENAVDCDGGGVGAGKAVRIVLESRKSLRGKFGTSAYIEL